MQLNVVQEGSRTEIQQYITFRYKFTGFHRIPRVSDVFRLSDLTVGSDTQQLPIGIRYQRFQQFPIGFLSEGVGNYRIPVGIYRITWDIRWDPNPGFFALGTYRIVPTNEIDQVRHCLKVIQHNLNIDLFLHYLLWNKVYR